MKTYAKIALGVPEILLPAPQVRPETWAVIACDQYTSEPEYWQRVDQEVGEAPSTLHLIYPEVFLAEPEPDNRIRAIGDRMRAYLRDGVFQTHSGMIYVEREAAGRTRRGLMVCLDLDAYDYNRGSASLIRATEGTIVSRLPPRVKVRQGAPLELPHIMVLIDDPQDTVMGPLAAAKADLPALYDFELMLGGGHLRGYSVSAPDDEAAVVSALTDLADPKAFARRYDLGPDAHVLLYAMGDGNHSLATAKAIWEGLKAAAPDPEDLAHDPRRYALVELVNLHDPALVFEPIHRVLFGVADVSGILADMQSYFGAGASFRSVPSLESMYEQVDASTAQRQRFGIVQGEHQVVVEIRDGGSNLPVGTLQTFLDLLQREGRVDEIDYVHGTEAVAALGNKAGNLGLFLPPMDKHDLFKTVIVDGALPRKTFSMGEADEKRFYMECRSLL